MDKIVTLAKQDLTPKVSDIDDVKTLVKAIQSDNWKDEVTKSVTKLVSKSVSKSVPKSVPKSNATYGLKIWQLILLLAAPRSRYEIFEHLGVINHSKNKTRFIDPLIEAGWLEMTIPDKPNSRLQQYRLTEEGKKLLKLK